MNSEQMQSILHDRAQKIARRQTLKPSSKGSQQFLIFSLNRKQYGISLKFIREVRVLNSITSAPGPEREYLGVVNVRGEIYTVVDLKQILSLPPEDNSLRGYMLVLKDPSLQVCLRVDHILDVQPIYLPDIMNLSESDSNRFGEFLKGYTQRKIFILDGEALLKAPSLIARSTSHNGTADNQRGMKFN